jgi:hypothetical protein
LKSARGNGGVKRRARLLPKASWLDRPRKTRVGQHSRRAWRLKNVLKNADDAQARAAFAQRQWNDEAP